MRQIDEINRRTVLGISAGAIGASAALATLTAQRAYAQVDMGELQINSGDFAPSDGSIYAPWLLIDGSFEYRVETEPAEWQVYLLIGDQKGNTQTVAVTSEETSASEKSGTYALRGAITESTDWGPEDFTVPEGEEMITTSVPCEVALVVRDADGSVLVQARAEDTAQVTVTSEGVITAGVSGVGTVVAQDDQGDPTPTPPGGD